MTRHSVAHDHVELEHQLKFINTKARALSVDGREVIELGDAIGELQLSMKAHHAEEERTLFGFAAKAHGGWEQELSELVRQHRELEAQLAAIFDLIHYESDLGAARAALRLFNDAFDAHTLAEADYFNTRWDELFPGEIMAG